MGFQDVAFVPSRASFHNNFFLKDSNRGQGFRTTTYPKTVVGGK